MKTTLRDVRRVCPSGTYRPGNGAAFVRVGLDVFEIVKIEFEPGCLAEIVARAPSGLAVGWAASDGTYLFDSHHGAAEAVDLHDGGEDDFSRTVEEVRREERARKKEAERRHHQERVARAVREELQAFRRFCAEKNRAVGRYDEPGVASSDSHTIRRGGSGVVMLYTSEELFRMWEDEKAKGEGP